MSFMGRGDFPSMNNNNNFSGRYIFYGRFRYYVPLDNTYVIMQLVMTFIILIVGFITFIITYKSTIVDPIESSKKIYINVYLIIIGILVVANLGINFMSKNEKTLITRLEITFIISMIIMLLFLGIKMNLDSKYTKNKFEQIYTEQSTREASNEHNKIQIGLTEIGVKSEKEYYVDECLKAYNIFSTKVYAILGLHFLLNILIIYQIIKISKLKGKKDRVDKDDLILFDEEENVKI